MKTVHLLTPEGKLIGTVTVPFNHPLLIIFGGSHFVYRYENSAYVQAAVYNVGSIELENHTILSL